MEIQEKFLLQERNLLKSKLKEIIEESKQNIDQKMQILTSLMISIKEENEKIISKCKSINK